MKPVFLAALLAAAAAAQPKPNPALTPVQDVPGLPRVLLIGDSISIGYTLPVRELLRGKANVHRIATNGGPTTNGMKNLDRWLGDAKWDVIHFNFGLHDLKIMDGGKHQVPLEQYETNLRAIVARLNRTGAKLIWASTTPVPKGNLKPPRNPADAVAYNFVAKKIAQEAGIPTDDLYGFVLPREEEWQLPSNVHFTKDGYQALARQVAESILKELPK
ncbi:MAG: SGNH/GDSL hydrolase family protein [Acidobacteria bacterium]|nr:SGNH/GDSL hydrolase family protein [Acidobacteriota bacterium]